MIAAALLLLPMAFADPASAGKRDKQKMHWRFPIPGPHDFGDLAVTGFGVPRGDGSRHTGQDVLSECGRRVVAVHGGKVLSSGHSAGYGNYLVLDALGSGFDFTYGHLKNGHLPKAGKVLRKGAKIGFVGDTGVESGTCHLHFEAWHGKWLQGKRTDPLPRLKGWDRFS